MEKLIGINEIANYLGVKVETMYAWVHQRKIPYYKIGRLVKFKISEVEKWMNQSRVEVLNFD